MRILVTALPGRYLVVGRTDTFLRSAVTGGTRPSNLSVAPKARGRYLVVVATQRIVKGASHRIVISPLPSLMRTAHRGIGWRLVADSDSFICCPPLPGFLRIHLLRLREPEFRAKARSPQRASCNRDVSTPIRHLRRQKSTRFR